MGIKSRWAIVFIFTILACVLFYQNCGNQQSFKTAVSSSSAVSEETPVGSPVLDPNQLEMTPSGCTDSPTPVCDGGVDLLRKSWGTKGIVTGATSDNGAVNNNLIRAKDPTSDAAAYCANMVYGGYSDWYLPSQKELMAMYYNRANFGHISDENELYWSSTEVSADHPYAQTLKPYGDTGAPAIITSFYKETLFLVRCIRKKTN